MAGPMRLSEDLVNAAQREALIQKRSTPKQIEYWAELGRTVERLITLDDVVSILQGFKKIKLETVESKPVDPDTVFRSFENQRKNKKIVKKLTAADFYFEPSLIRPGMLDKVDSVTGNRQTGTFKDGMFIVEA